MHTVLKAVGEQNLFWASKTWKFFSPTLHSEQQTVVTQLRALSYTGAACTTRSQHVVQEKNHYHTMPEIKPLCWKYCKQQYSQRVPSWNSCKQNNTARRAQTMQPQHIYICLQCPFKYVLQPMPNIYIYIYIKGHTARLKHRNPCPRNVCWQWGNMAKAVLCRLNISQLPPMPNLSNVFSKGAKIVYMHLTVVYYVGQEQWGTPFQITTLYLKPIIYKNKWLCGNV